MKKHCMFVILTLILPTAWSGAEDCRTISCADIAISQTQSCDQDLQPAMPIHLPDSVWQLVIQGQPLRLIVVIVDADLKNLPRPDQLAAYQIRKKKIFQSLPSKGATVLRQFDQLPIIEMEVKTDQVLRRLLMQCYVANVYLDKEEQLLSPRATP